MNNQIFFFFYNLAHQSELLDKIIVFTAEYFPYLVIIMAGLFLLFHHEVFRAESSLQVFMQKKKEIFLAFISGLLAWLVSQILKILIHTPRPFDALPQVQSLFPQNGHAFPSGHATFLFALAFSIFFIHKKVGYVFIFFALVIGVARIVAGVHFPIDILGGFLLGGLVSCLVAFFSKNI